MLSVVAALVIGLTQQDAPAPPPPPPADAQAQVAMAVSLFNQVYRNWTVSCEPEGVRNIRVAFDVEIDRTGQLVGSPAVVRPEDSPEFRLVADSAMRALIDSTPFEVPAGFAGGRYRPTFVMARVCSDR